MLKRHDPAGGRVSEASARAGDGASAATTPEALPSAGADRLLRRVRWIAAGLCALQFSLYSPPIGVQLPFSRWWGAVPTSMLIAINVVAVARARRGRPTGSVWPMAQLVWDCLITAVIIGMFSFDDTSALWALLIIPVLEAATRGWRTRALITFGVLCIGYVARELVVSQVYPYNDVTPDSITYRLGVLGLVAMTAAGLAGRLTRQIAVTEQAQRQAEHLRGVAVAARRMSSLDLPTVVDEVTHAAEALGFTSVGLFSRDGSVPGTAPLAASDGSGAASWFEQAVVAGADRGYAVLDRRLGDLTGVAGWQLGPDEVVVAAPMTSPGTPHVLLLGRHADPVPPGQGEGLALLATQANAALANARRYEDGRAFEARLAHDATHDPLTGLPNRALLADRAVSALARSARHHQLVAVIFIDLDGFKEINDVLGHATGDALLRAVGNRLVAHLRPEDTCARLGGDEFVVLTSDQPDHTSILTLATRLQSALHEPFAVHDLTLDVEASMGVAWAPHHAEDIETLLHHADIAMYAAKANREGVAIYQSDFERQAPAQLTTLGDLRRALDGDGQLTTAFQPIIEVRDGRLHSVEALLRWAHPTRGEVAPDDFIPIAEGTTLIRDLTDWVIGDSLRSLRQWRDAAYDVTLAVNLAPRTLLDPSLPNRITRLLSQHRIDPAHLRLELTERTLLADPTRAITTMHRLTDIGLHLSIDDFGTGYFSMSHITQLPVDQIKIDRSFVTDMLESHHDLVMVRSIIDLAHSLGLKVVAEGVQDAATLDQLRELGADLAQGFHIAHPLLANDFRTWADERQAREPSPARARTPSID
jgi:diguanylate cyclase (GGDEF)-like protein